MGITMTWKLWRALHVPFIAHPIFKQSLAKHKSPYKGLGEPKSPFPTLGFTGTLGQIIGGLAVVLIMCAGGWLVVVPLMCCLSFMMLFTGTIAGLINAMKVSGQIAKEYETGRADLLGVTLAGMPSCAWAHCSAIFHTSKSLRQIRDLARTTRVVFSIVCAMAISLLALQAVSTERALIDKFTNFLDNAAVVGFIALVLAAIYFDYVQSTIIGCLTGMLVPTYVPRNPEARFMALAVFLGMQFAVYVVVWMFNFGFMPTIYDALTLKAWVVLPVLQFVFFVAFRELLIGLLWRLLARRMESDTTEFNNIAAQIPLSLY